MAKYEVLTGSHQTRGKLFRAGEVVESNKQLDALYPKRYRAVTGAGTAGDSEPKQAQPRIPTGDNVPDQRGHEARKKG